MGSAYHVLQTFITGSVHLATLYSRPSTRIGSAAKKKCLRRLLCIILPPPTALRFAFIVALKSNCGRTFAFLVPSLIVKAARKAEEEEVTGGIESVVTTAGRKSPHCRQWNGMEGKVDDRLGKLENLNLMFPPPSTITITRPVRPLYRSL